MSVSSFIPSSSLGSTSAFSSESASQSQASQIPSSSQASFSPQPSPASPTTLITPTTPDTTPSQSSQAPVQAAVATSASSSAPVATLTTDTSSPTPSSVAASASPARSSLAGSSPAATVAASVTASVTDSNSAPNVSATQSKILDVPPSSSIPPPPPSSSLSISNSASVSSQSSDGLSSSGSLSDSSSAASSASASGSSSGISSQSSGLSSSGALGSSSSADITNSEASIAAAITAGVASITLTSEVVATIGGTPTTYVTLIPTSLNEPPGKLTSSERTGVIVASAVGGFAIIVAALAGAILYRRIKRRQVLLAHRRLPTPRRLEDEDAFDLGEQGGRDPFMAAYPYLDDHPTLLRPRATDSGSIFHEGVWPPPGHRLEDPIRASSNVDLSSIVDSVMGSDGAEGPHAGGAGAAHIRGGGYQQVHSREPSDGSQLALLNRSAAQSPVSDTRSVTFADTARSAKAREANAARSRLSLVTMPAETTPLTTRNNDDGPGGERMSTGSVYSAASLQRGNNGHPGDLPPGAAAPLRGPQLLVDVDEENNARGGRVTEELPPLYHTIRRDTNTSEEARTTEEINEDNVGQAL